MLVYHVAAVMHAFGLAAPIILLDLRVQVVKTAFEGELVIAAKCEKLRLCERSLALWTLARVFRLLFLNFKTQSLAELILLVKPLLQDLLVLELIMTCDNHHFVKAQLKRLIPLVDFLSELVAHFSRRDDLYSLLLNGRLLLE
jgi:hypothetical protein